jgi:hypothetical protein
VSATFSSPLAGVAAPTTSRRAPSAARHVSQAPATVATRVARSRFVEL